MIKRFVNKYYLVFLIGLITIIIVLWYLLSGGNHIFYVHDNLDSNFVFYKILGESGKLFASNETIVPGIMNGLPRATYPSELNVLTLLYSIFKPERAYLINEIAAKLVAYAGMFLLLAGYVFKTKNYVNGILVAGFSVAFAFLPFYPWGGLSVAGQPLVLWAYLNIRQNRHHASDWLIIGLMPFYSSLILSGIFFLVLISFLFLRDTLKKLTINYRFLFSIVFMSIGYLIGEYRLLLTLFNSVFISHRVEFVKEALSFSAMLASCKSMLLNGQYHAHSLQAFYILPFILIASFILILPTKVRKYFIFVFIVLGILALSLSQINVFDWNRFISTTLLVINPYYLFGIFILITSIFFFNKMCHEGLLSLGILAIAIWYGAWQSEFILSIKNAIPFINQIQFDRFYFLNSLLWFLLFAFVAQKLVENEKRSLILIIAIVASQIAYSAGMATKETWRQPMSLEQFYLPELFAEAKQVIGKPVDTYRVASIGIEPLVAAYNGFYTLDGYCANYPLHYKHEFRKIIEGELAKDENCRKYFDNWGSRCYIFYCQKIVDGKSIENLSLNTKQFKGMGGEFIFSKYIIQNEKECGLSLVKELKQNDETLYLYQSI